MSAQRNSLSGRMKYAEPAAPPVVSATADTEIKTTPKAIVSIIVACVAAAVMWATLSLTVSAHGARISQTEGEVVELKRGAANSNRQIEKLDDRTASLEAWRKEMEQQRADIRAIRAILEAQAKQKSP